jgi:pimeloyl-ACP methyl ester carboxylesterase
VTLPAGIPFFTLGDTGPALYFLHANGYPPECYRPLLSRLSEYYRVIAMRQRPLWPGSDPRELSDWLPLTDDLIRFMDERQAGTSICIGHSFGAVVALRAALTHPGCFRALVLIDPVLMPPYAIRCWQAIRLLGLSSRLHPFILAARRRRRSFDDLERLFQGYRSKPVFRFMDDAALHAYVEGISCPIEHGYELCYPAGWEERIYLTGIWRDLDIWRGLPGLRTPLLLVRGAETDTFWASTARRVLRKVPSARLVTVPQASHLVPLEQPAEVYRAIQQFLQENL